MRTQKGLQSLWRCLQRSCSWQNTAGGDPLIAQVCILSGYMELPCTEAVDAVFDQL